MMNFVINWFGLGYLVAVFAGLVLYANMNTVLEWFRNCCTTVHGSERIVKGSSNMGKASDIRKKIESLEEELALATRLPDADDLRTGDVFENDEGQGRILVVDGAYFRLVGAKKGQVLRNVFSSKEAVLEHMESNGYSKRA